MTKVKFRSGQYYAAIAWCMTNLKIKEWKGDPLNSTIDFPNKGVALMMAMKYP